MSGRRIDFSAEQHVCRIQHEEPTCVTLGDMTPVNDAPMTTTETDIVTRLKAALAEWPDLQAAFLFGSLANDTAQVNSDLDLAVQMSGTLTAEKKIALIHHLAERFGRSIDVVDLRQAGQPLLGEIAAKAVLVKGTATDRGNLFFRSIMMQEDFVPYQQRILAGRRKQWLNHE